MTKKLLILIDWRIEKIFSRVQKVKKALFKLKKTVQISLKLMPRNYIAPRYLRETFESYKRRRTTKPKKDAIEPINLSPKQLQIPTMLPRINDHRKSNYVPTNYNAFKFQNDQLINPIILYRRFISATSNCDIDPNYSLQLVKCLTLKCPPLLYLIPIDNINKLRWEHSQYDREVTDLFDSNIKRMAKWLPDNQTNRDCLKFCIENIIIELDDFIRRDYFTLSCDEREYYGVFTEFKFDVIKREASELLECVKESNINLNVFPIKLGHLGVWIAGNKNLQSMFFKLISYLFTIGDFRAGMLDVALEFLKSVKVEEEVRNHFAEVISVDEDTTELSVIEANPPEEDEEGLIDIFITPEESQKIYDELFYNPKRSKK